jgi:phosphoesterase RecJ-like protein
MIDQFKKLSLDELCRSVAQNKRTLILYHVRPDADAVGSAFALRELLRVMNIPAYCACSDEIPERLLFLVDGAQGSTLIEGDLKLDYERVIAVDSAAPSQLGPLFDRLHRDVDIMIDHHAKGTAYADNYIDTDAAATGEIIYRMARRMVELGYIDSIPERTLNSLYAAISADTGCFKFANTTPQTMRIAAELMEEGVDFSHINTLLYDSKPMVQIKAEGEAIYRLKTYMDGKISSVVFPYSLKCSLGASSEHLETLIDVARSVGGTEVAFVVKQNTEEKLFNVSMRSMGSVDVSEICARFGGGGHKRAAGCRLVAESAESAEKKLLEEIVKKF